MKRKGGVSMTSTPVELASRPSKEAEEKDDPTMTRSCSAEQDLESQQVFTRPLGQVPAAFLPASWCPRCPHCLRGSLAALGGPDSRTTPKKVIVSGLFPLVNHGTALQKLCLDASPLRFSQPAGVFSPLCFSLVLSCPLSVSASSCLVPSVFLPCPVLSPLRFFCRVPAAFLPTSGCPICPP